MKRFRCSLPHASTTIAQRAKQYPYSTVISAYILRYRSNACLVCKDIRTKSGSVNSLQRTIVDSLRWVKMAAFTCMRSVMMAWLRRSCRYWPIWSVFACSGPPLQTPISVLERKITVATCLALWMEPWSWRQPSIRRPCSSVCSVMMISSFLWWG
jgi:hypothetical protein